MSNLSVRGLWKHQNGSWYYSRMEGGKKISVALGTKDETEAAQKVKDFLKIKAKRTSCDTIENEIGGFVAEKEKKGAFSRFAAPEKKRTLLKFAEFHGKDKFPSSVTPGVMERYLKYLRDERKAPSVVLACMMTVHSFFAWLVQKKKIEANPCENIEYGDAPAGASKKVIRAPKSAPIAKKRPPAGLSAQRGGKA